MYISISILVIQKIGLSNERINKDKKCRYGYINIYTYASIRLGRWTQIKIYRYRWRDIDRYSSRHRERYRCRHIQIDRNLNWM